MNSLREIQTEFFAALFADKVDTCSWLQECGIAVAERIQIYRNNMQFNFVAALRATYPVIEKLSGIDWFTQTAQRYQRVFPSRSGDLQNIGAQFAGFLQSELAGSAFAYFAHVARLEWAYQEVLIAAETAPFNPALLAQVAVNDYSKLIFVVRPSVRLVAAPFPLLAIWKANQADVQPSGETIDLASGASRVLLIRRDDHVELRELSPTQFALLDTFMHEQTLDTALAAAANAHGDFDVNTDLQRLFELQTIAACRVDTKHAH